MTQTVLERRSVKDAFGVDMQAFQKSTVKIFEPTPGTPKKKFDYVFKEDVLKRLLLWSASGSLPPNMFNTNMKRNLYIFGPTGCGKTVLVSQFCGIVGRTLVSYQCNEETTVSDLFGSYKLAMPSNASELAAKGLPVVPSMEWIDGPVLRWAKTPNAVLLLDEFDQLEPHVAMRLNDVLDGRDLSIPELGDQVVKISEGAIIAVTANTNGRGSAGGKSGSSHVYRGTKSQNIATMDRFFVLHMTYLSEEEEIEHLIKATKVPRATATAMAKLATMIRNSFIGLSEDAGEETGESLDFTMSTRNLENWAISYMLLSGGGVSPANALYEALEFTMLDFLDSDQREAIKDWLKTKVIGGATTPST